MDSLELHLTPIWECTVFSAALVLLRMISYVSLILFSSSFRERAILTLSGVIDFQIVDALLQSIEDKCDIVTLSLGGSAGWLDQSPSQTIVERMNGMGIITTVSAGNDQSEGLFYANGPAATRTGISVGSVYVQVFFSS